MAKLAYVTLHHIHLRLLAVTTFGSLLLVGGAASASGQQTLASFGKGFLTIDEASVIGTYQQTDQGISFGPSVALADQAGGRLEPIPAPATDQNLGLIMRLNTGANPNLPFSVYVFDANDALIARFQGTTEGVGQANTFVSLQIAERNGSSRPIGGLLLTWDGSDRIDLTVLALAVATPPTQPPPTQPPASPEPPPQPPPPPAPEPPVPDPPSPQEPEPPPPSAAPDYTTISKTFIGNVTHGGQPGQMSIALSKGRATGQLRLNGKTVALRGTLSPQGVMTANLPAWLGSQLRLSVEGEAGKETISARIDSVEVARLLAVDVTGRTNDRFAMNGWRFNLVMINGAELQGFASASANASGVVRVTGRLGDGRPFTASARVVRDPEDGHLVLPVLTRLAKNAGEVWGELLLLPDPEEGQTHLAGQLMIRRAGAEPQEVRVLGSRWEPKARVNLLDPLKTLPVAIEASVGESEPITLEWPLSNRLVNRELGWQIAGNALSGGFSGRGKNGAVSGTLSGVLLAEDMNLGELGAAVRGVGLFTTRGATRQVVLVVP